MSLRIGHSSGIDKEKFDAVVTDLSQIMSPDGGGLTVNDKTGDVTLGNPPSSTGSLLLQELVDRPYPITLTRSDALPNRDEVQPPAYLYREADPAWGALIVTTPNTAPAPDLVVQSLDVRYRDHDGDDTFCVRVQRVITPGPEEYDWDPEPSWLILLYMLHLASYAGQAVQAPWGADWADRAFKAENDYRVSNRMFARVTNQVQHCPFVYDLGGCGCFIATAAYGSAFEPEVASLRHFRDDVLLRTRTGAAFFERFYRQYYRFSPAIAAAIERDPEAREIARWGVAPIVRYLELAQNFPNAELDGVPEPWRGFLADTREKLEAWGRSTGLPEDLLSLPPVQAAAELALALRYLLRSEDSRQDYLRHLAALGELPIPCAEQEYDACARVLLAAGRPGRELTRLLSRGSREGRS